MTQTLLTLLAIMALMASLCLIASIHDSKRYKQHEPPRYEQPQYKPKNISPKVFGAFLISSGQWAKNKLKRKIHHLK